MVATQEIPQYRWTRTGMVVIAHLLRGTLAYNKANQRKPNSIRSFDGTSPTTVRSYMTASVHVPQLRLGIAAIAPHLYYYVGLEGGDKILFDPERRYRNWQELAEHVGTMSAQFGPSTELIDELEAMPIKEGESVQQALVPPFVEDTPAGERQSTLIQQFQSILEQYIAPLRADVAELKRQQFAVVGQAIAEPSSPLEVFLDGWFDQASGEQLKTLNMEPGAHSWSEKREAIVLALQSEGGLTEDRAEAILGGADLDQPEHFIMNYLFSEPVTMRPYPLSHWDRLAPAEHLIAS